MDWVSRMLGDMTILTVRRRKVRKTPNRQCVPMAEPVEGQLQLVRTYHIDSTGLNSGETIRTAL